MASVARAPLKVKPQICHWTFPIALKFDMFLDGRAVVVRPVEFQTYQFKLLTEGVLIVSSLFDSAAAKGTMDVFGATLFFLEFYHLLAHCMILFRFRLLPSKDLARQRHYFLVDTLTVATSSFLYTQNLRWLATIQILQHMFFYLNWNKHPYAIKVKRHGTWCWNPMGDLSALLDLCATKHPWAGCSPHRESVTPPTPTLQLWCILGCLPAWMKSSANISISQWNQTIYYLLFWAMVFQHIWVDRILFCMEESWEHALTDLQQGKFEYQLLSTLLHEVDPIIANLWPRNPKDTPSPPTALSSVLNHSAIDQWNDKNIQITPCY